MSGADEEIAEQMEEMSGVMQVAQQDEVGPEGRL